MSDLPPSPSLLLEQGTYPCPVCRCGEISTLALMEAMSCNFCSHIFSTDLSQQSISLADSHRTLTWRWNGKVWKSFRHAGAEVGWDTLIVALAFVVLPPLVVGCAAYIFPPLPGTPGAWFPLAWTGLVFLVHLGCVLWLAIEYYQMPVNLYARALSRRWLDRIGMG